MSWVWFGLSVVLVYVRVFFGDVGVEMRVELCKY